MELVIILVCVALVVGIGALIRNTEAPSVLIDLDRRSSTLAGSGHVKSANVSEAHKVSESSSERTDSDKPKVQFSVGKLMLWTAIVGVGLAVSTQSGNGLDGVFTFVICLGLACGISIFFENPRSPKIWFPVGMLLVCFVLCGVSYEVSGYYLIERIGPPALISGLVYGFVLLVFFGRQTERHGFSLTLLVFWLVCWLLFMYGMLWIWLFCTRAMMA